jgi:succinate dehydrogenase / fumarate reductase cytochrome b subunit
VSQSAASRLSGRTYLVLRRLHSLTGIIFGGYLVVHLVVNATIAQGGNAFQAQVDKLEGLVWLPIVEWVFIYLPIIYHTFYGIYIILTGQPNNVHYPYAKNWFYLFQRISAVYLIGFIAFHVLSLRFGIFAHELGFDTKNALATVATHFHYSPVISWVIYPLGILASAYHTANGFWTAAITWGLTSSAGAQRRWGYVCTLLFVLLLAAGMVALIAAAALPTTPGSVPANAGVAAAAR